MKLAIFAKIRIMKTTKHADYGSRAGLEQVEISTLSKSSLILFNSSPLSTKVRHKKRFSGDSNYKFKNLFSLWFDMISNYHFYPIRIGSFVGLFSKIIILLVRILSRKSKVVQYKIKETNF